MATSLTVKQGDTFPPVDLTVYDPNGVPLNLPVGTSVRFHMGKTLRGGASLIRTGQLIDGPTGRISYQWQAGDTGVAGGFLAEFQLTLPDGRVLTVPNDDWIEILIVKQLG